MDKLILSITGVEMVGDQIYIQKSMLLSYRCSTIRCARKFPLDLMEVLVMGYLRHVE